MTITTEYTQIGNGIYHLKVDKGELEIILNSLECFAYTEFCIQKTTEKQPEAKVMIKEISEALE